MIETPNTIEKALVSALLFESAGKASAMSNPSFNRTCTIKRAQTI